MFCLQFYGIQLYQYQNSIGLLLQQQAKISPICKPYYFTKDHSETELIAK